MVKVTSVFLLIICFQFSYAQEDGDFVEFFEDGKLKTEGQYKNKKKDGEWRTYHPNGQLAEVFTYTDGKRDREYTAFLSMAK